MSGAPLQAEVAPSPFTTENMTKGETTNEAPDAREHAEALPTLMKMTTSNSFGKKTFNSKNILDALEEGQADREATSSEKDERETDAQPQALDALEDLIADVNPYLRMLPLSTALVLFVFQVLCLLNVFFMLRRPFLYMLLIYNMLCSMIIVIVEGKHVWFQKCENVQARVLRLVPCLAWAPGRALFYFLVGCFNTSFFGWSWVFALCGSLLNLSGFITLASYCFGC